MKTTTSTSLQAVFTPLTESIQTEQVKHAVVQINTEALFIIDSITLRLIAKALTSEFNNNKGVKDDDDFKIFLTVTAAFAEESPELFLSRAEITLIHQGLLEIMGVQEELKKRDILVEDISCPEGFNPELYISCKVLLLEIKLFLSATLLSWDRDGK